VHQWLLLVALKHSVLSLLMLDWIKNSPQSIYALLGDYGMGKTFSCRILSAKLTEEEGAIKPFYIDLRDTPTFITEKDIVRQPGLILSVFCVCGRLSLGLLLYIASKPLITLSTKAFFLSGVEQSTKKSPDPSSK
jgi:ABC-type hemin transport system ATPase subunit